MLGVASEPVVVEELGVSPVDFDIEAEFQSNLFPFLTQVKRKFPSTRCWFTFLHVEPDLTGAAASVGPTEEITVSKLRARQKLSNLLLAPNLIRTVLSRPLPVRSIFLHAKTFNRAASNIRSLR
jgi:hypothetical protein